MSDLTKDEAIRLVREYSWLGPGSEATCGHTGCEDHLGEGERMIHSYGSFGCDIPLAAAEEYITEAREVKWADHLLRHDLAVVTSKGRVICFDVPREAADAHA